jgi:hypothetical protein|tara:strand:+ start:70 stop:453 length:384 start_codon:yes stop_codon:yes gene_type:complete
VFFFILLFVFIILFLFPPPPLDPAKQSHGEKLIQNNNSIFFCVFRCDGLDGPGAVFLSFSFFSRFIIYFLFSLLFFERRKRKIGIEKDKLNREKIKEKEGRDVRRQGKMAKKIPTIFRDLVVFDFLV